MSRRRFIGSRLAAGLICCLVAGVSLAAAPDPFDALAAQLNASDPEKQFSAVEKLAETGDPRAAPLLIAALERDMHERSGIAMMIIPVLGAMGDALAVPILIRTLEKREDDWLGREAAAAALGEIGAVEAVPPLLNAAWMADTRSNAIQALATIGDPRAVEVLISAFDPAEEPEARDAAVEGLARIGPQAIPALIEKLGSWSKEYPANEERAVAATVLGEIGHASARQALTTALDDPSEAVRSSARTALKRLPP